MKKKTTFLLHHILYVRIFLFLCYKPTKKLSHHFLSIRPDYKVVYPVEPCKIQITFSIKTLQWTQYFCMLFNAKLILEAILHLYP